MSDELKKTVQAEYLKQAMLFILRQTEYDEETALNRLRELNDPVKVVAEYLGVKPRPQPQAQSKNQMKYGEIRKFMDFGARQYRLQQEYQQQKQQLQEQQQQRKEQQEQQEQQKQQEQQD
jgi:hypothetical protein